VRTGNIALGTLIAFAVSVICLLPPGIHFVTGPIGPAIGGYVAGNRLKLTGAESAVVGFSMAVALAGSAIAAIELFSFGPDLALQTSIPLSLIGAIYVGALGTAGCWIAARNTS
jgi:hypothetical protein